MKDAWSWWSQSAPRTIGLARPPNFGNATFVAQAAQEEWIQTRPHATLPADVFMRRVNDVATRMDQTLHGWIRPHLGKGQMTLTPVQCAVLLDCEMDHVRQEQYNILVFTLHMRGFQPLRLDDSIQIHWAVPPPAAPCVALPWIK
jgi:hypothetical protein